MVFESVVVHFLGKYLSSYFENIDNTKLKIGIWRGLQNGILFFRLIARSHNKGAQKTLFTSL